MGAFTSGGKTTVCVRECIQKATAGHPVLYVTAELSAVEIARRIDAGLPQDPPELPVHVWGDSPELHEVLGVIERWAQPLDGGQHGLGADQSRIERHDGDAVQWPPSHGLSHQKPSPASAFATSHGVGSNRSPYISSLGSSI